MQEILTKQNKLEIHKLACSGLQLKHMTGTDLAKFPWIATIVHSAFNRFYKGDASAELVLGTLNYTNGELIEITFGDTGWEFYQQCCLELRP